MKKGEPRRLTGGNLLMGGAGATIDLYFDAPGARDAFVEELKVELAFFWEAMGWPWNIAGENQTFHCRCYETHCTIAVAAPLDVLYTSVAALEAAVDVIQARHTETHVDKENLLQELKKEREQESNPRLIEMRDAASARGVPFLWDDDDVSVGYGHFAQVWPARELPRSDEVDWDKRGSIPTALITGTNGKTTTTRLLSRIAMTAGFTVGTTTTDGIFINGTLADAGDWTGPGGGRTVLRRSEINFGVLETARGGLLRRGLPIDRCDVAIVTNVAADHLGEYGILTVEDMAQTKILVGHAVHSNGRIVLNGEDAFLMKHAHQFKAPVILFAKSAETASVKNHLLAGGEAIFLNEGHIVFAPSQEREEWVNVAHVDKIPMTFGGAAVHNVHNVMAAVAAAITLGVPMDSIRQGLNAFSSSPADNPGRANLYYRDGVHLLLDFAHNPHGATLAMDLIRTLRSRSKYPEGMIRVVTGQAGDRSNTDIEDFARAIFQGGAHHVLVRQMHGYERGRAPGEVEAVFRDAFLSFGMDASRVAIVEDEIASLELAMKECQAGDFVAIFTHMQRDAVSEWLADNGWTSASTLQTASAANGK